MEKPKRFDEISIMRIMAMTMIICFHSLCFYNGKWVKVNALSIPFWVKVSNFIDSIDLNMFVFISGYLYGYLYIYKNKYRHPSEVIRNKAMRLLLPYCFWGVIMVAFPWNTWSKLLYGISHLWFLLMLFGVFTLTVILQMLNAQRIRFTYKIGMALIVIGYLAWYVLSNYIIPGDILCITRTLYYFPAFMIGYVCAKLRIGWYMPGKAFFLLPIATAVLFAFTWYEIPLHGEIRRIVRLVSAYAICVCLLIILSKTPLTGKWKPLVFKVEQLSMGTYIFNQIAMDLIFICPLLHRWFETHWMIGPFVLFLLGFFPPLFMSYLFNKCRWLRWSMGS